MINKIKLSNFSLLKEASFQMSDLTVLVGPQATGKSLVLQMIKLLEDKKSICQQLEQYNYSWKDIDEFAEFYYGEGMHGFLHNTEVVVGKTTINLNSELKYRRGYARNQKQKCFYIPAQRVLIIEDGWPKAFETMENSFPYVSRELSATLREYLSRMTSIFPVHNRLKSYLRNDIAENIYHNSTVTRAKSRGKNRIQLHVANSDHELPVSMISAGQREFLRLLLSLYCLLPSGHISKVDGLDTVIIEEPEMGLHPQGIRTVFLSIVELLNRGYRVYVSTHSVDLMNYIWALRMIQKESGSANRGKALEQLLDLKTSQVGQQMIDRLPNLKTSVYFFERKDNSVTTHDISDLDLDEEGNISPWGGFLRSASISADVIASL